VSDYHRPFAEQVAFFKAKLNLPSERWDDIRHEEHDRSFIVAGAKAADLLADLYAAVLKTQVDGTGLNAFRKDFKSLVARNGWTGWTGEGSQAGVAWRTKVIYQTNLATSYAAGRYQQLTDPELLAVLPYWQYKHSDGVMFPRPLHVSWNGLTLSPDHPFWKTHFAPNGWGCHCRIIAVPKSDYLKAIANGRGPANAPAADDLAGIDPGFAYTPGASVSAELRALADSKLVKLPAPIGAAMAESTREVLAIEERAAEFRAWAERVRQDGKPTGDWRVIGVIESQLIDKMNNLGVTPATAEIVTRDEDVLHAHRDSKRDALPWEWFLDLPANIGQRRAVILDASDTGPALLYVFDLDGRPGKLVVKLDYEVVQRGADGIKRKKAMNILRTGRQFNDLEALNQPGHHVIEGSLK